MVNDTLMYNVTNNIADTFVKAIGVSSDLGDNVSTYLIGAVVLIIFLFWIFKSGLGIWGLVVIIPALLMIMTADDGLGLFPKWISSIVVILIGLIWGFIILRLFREA